MNILTCWLVTCRPGNSVLVLVVEAPILPAHAAAADEGSSPRHRSVLAILRSGAAARAPDAAFDPSARPSTQAGAPPRRRCQDERSQMAPSSLTI